MTEAASPALLAGLPLARGLLDRADAMRADRAGIERLWAEPRARIVPLAGDLMPVEAEAGPGSGGRGVRLSVSANRDVAGLRLFLGFDQLRAPVFAVCVAEVAEGQQEQLRSLRQAGSRLPAADAAIFVTAVALANWHNTHQYCPKCGAATVVERGGWVRRCPDEGSEHFPRTDPAVIMLLVDTDDRALLGRRSPWPTAWFSTLAGFVEPGESAEAAVVRETGEEVGLSVDQGALRYRGSQPWPFPSSLMLGYQAPLVPGSSTEPVPDQTEIAEARWFHRADLAAACESGEVQVPPPVSIARHLIEEWYGAALPGSWGRS